MHLPVVEAPASGTTCGECRPTRDGPQISGALDTRAAYRCGDRSRKEFKSARSCALAGGSFHCLHFFGHFQRCCSLWPSA